MATGIPRPDRAEQVADTALSLLAERGLRGLTHRAVDEAAGLPQGSTSNVARTRAALLELTVRRLAEREKAVLTPAEMPQAAGGLEGAVDAMALALHRYLSAHRPLLVARYELALEASRRPELRALYDAEGRGFREPVEQLLSALGSRAPRRHALSLVAWCDGILFACSAGSYHTAVPSRRELRDSVAELLRGMLTV
ncbi:MULTISPECIES: TetR/AcrR family transcriptional regulator [Streptomyces]|uniref:TetR/AcrR family transcriptional regulator n=1 Tax=Streptomyces lycii TaxID=2654337 RepID=A0ABQ7FJP4_9ACTN|nr:MULTISPECIES: TetR/AcrR family transcriptional regulator [Streptomyces]KAF4408842.1 TetR/AcrR family transcriptional regulator [Streptomyces lycii]PGH51730.1 TetR family transcriptional regulator [Streptomyces sp. Ru87]